MRTLLLIAHEDPIRLEESDDIDFVQEMLSDYGALDVTDDELFESAYRNGQDPSDLFSNSTTILDTEDEITLDSDIVAAKERLLDILPYAIPDQRMNNWLVKTKQRDADRLMWHVNRSCFISGTRVGTFVAGKEDIPDQMGKDPSMVVREMLLMLPPQKSIGAMRRGIALEPLIDEMFLSGEWLKGTDLDGSRIEIFKTPAVMLWSDKETPDGPRYSGNPDRVVNIYPPNNGGVLRFVVDYKAPASIEHYTHGNPLGYMLQVDHYRWGLREHNITTHGGMVCYLDLKNWNLHVVMNPPDMFEKNVERIQDASRHYWHNYVKLGVVPDFRPRVVFNPEKHLEELEYIGSQTAYYKACKDAADKQLDRLRDELTTLTDGQAFDTCPIGNGLLNLGSKWAPDADRIAEFFISHDLKPPMVEQITTKRDLDMEKAQAIMLRMGVNPDSAEFQTQSIRIAFPRSKSDPHIDAVTALRTLTLNALDITLPNIIDQVNKVPLTEPPAKKKSKPKV